MFMFMGIQEVMERMLSLIIEVIQMEILIIIGQLKEILIPITGEEGTKTFPDYNNGYGGTTSSSDNYEYDESTTIPDYNSWYDETNTSLDYSTEDMGKYSRKISYENT